MKLPFVLLACLVLTATLSGADGEGYEEGTSGTEVGCSAFAALKIRVTRGRCRGKAGASCAAVASSQSVFKEASNAWWSEGNGCESAKIEEAALAIAEACASVYVETIAKVSCDGKGFACGFAIGEGTAMAAAFAKAIANVAVDASNDYVDAFCVADVEAVSGAIAEAAASAESKACVKDVGSQEDFKSAFVETVAEAIAEAFVKATAKTCSEEGTAAASSICEGEAESTQTGTTEAEATEGAEAEGKSTQLDACENPGECCDPDFKSSRCWCPDCSRPWLRMSEAKGARLRSWRVKRGVVCFCYPDHVY